MKHEWKFSVSKEVSQMINALENSPAVRRIVYFALGIGYLLAFKWW